MPPAAELAATVSSPDILRQARLARLLQELLEASVWAVVIVSVLAFGSVHHWAYSPLWIGCFAAAALALARAVAAAGLRQRLGPHLVAFHVSGRWLVVEPHSADHALGWSIDLAERAFPRGSLLLPAVAFLALTLLQLVPLAGGPATLAPEATRRGITFVVAFLLLHQAAAAAFSHPAARRRFRKMLAWLGAALALVALAQLASGTRLIYGFFESLEGGHPYGSFVNRNHFAGYMLLVVPIALGLLADAWRAYARRVGDSPNARRSLVGLQTSEGTRLVYAALPPLLGIGALLASTSRGGHPRLLRRARPGGGGGALAARDAGVGGGARLRGGGADVVRPRAAGGALRAGDGRRAGAHGGVGRVARGDAGLALGHGLRLQRLRRGALPRAGVGRCPRARRRGREGTETALLTGEAIGYRAPGDLPGLAWYREAHSDYVQLLVETGVPGLLIGLWAGFAALAAARRDPWLFAALAGLLMHVFVDFDLQIPAIAALFVVLAGLPRASSPV